MDRRLRVLIDASNLHNGGAVQVAASFIDEIASGYELMCAWSFRVSSSVAACLSPWSLAQGVQVEDFHPRDRWQHPPDRGFDVVFSPFGPTFRRVPRARRITGYANLTGLVLPLGRSPGARLRQHLVIRELARHDVVVVETSDFARRVLAAGVDATRIQVIPNVLNGVFLNESQWLPSVQLADRSGSALRLFFPARPYAHKNHKMLVDLALLLRARGIDVEYVLTLNSEEVEAVDPRLAAFALPIGQVPVTALPHVYKSCDAVLFPSSAEVSSATPIEAMYMGRVVIGAGIPAVIEACGDAALYFDPGSVQEACRAVQRFATLKPDELARLRRAGQERIASLPDARQRAERYIALITDSRPGAD